MSEPIYVGEPLKIHTLYNNQALKRLSLNPAQAQRIDQNRKDFLRQTGSSQVYGVHSGFGAHIFAETPPDPVECLFEHLLCGSGESVEVEVLRLTWVLRTHTLAKAPVFAPNLYGLSFGIFRRTGLMYPPSAPWEPVGIWSRTLIYSRIFVRVQRTTESSAPMHARH